MSSAQEIIVAAGKVEGGAPELAPNENRTQSPSETKGNREVG